MAASGCELRIATCCSSLCGNQTSSASKKAMYSPLAWVIPRLREALMPRFWWPSCSI